MFDSIRESITHKPSFYGDFNTRNSFISNYRAQVKGILAGVNFNKQFTLAIGYNWLSTDFKKTFNQTDTATLRLRYISPFIEYSFVEKNNFIVSIPIYIGFGNSFYQKENKEKLEKHLVFLYEPSMKVTYRFFKYFSVSGGIGYRLMLVGNKKSDKRFSSPTYTVGIGLFIGDIYRDGKKLFD